MRLGLQNKTKVVETSQRISTKIFDMFFTLLAAGTLFLPEVFSVFFNSRYKEAWVLVPILLLAYIFKGLYGFLNRELILDKKSGDIARISTISGITNIFLNLIFVPGYGVYAAATSTLAALFLSFILGLKATGKSLKSIILYINFRSILLYFLVAMVTYVTYFLEISQSRDYVVLIILKFACMGLIVLYSLRKKHLKSYLSLFTAVSSTDYE